MTTESHLVQGLASGHGIATMSGSTVLDVWFPSPALGSLVGDPSQVLKDCVGKDPIRNSHT
jgi:2,3,4,5-tetrahydropyridine-2,6-dicarboxylate N-succinyltransferase